MRTRKNHRRTEPLGGEHRGFLRGSRQKSRARRARHRSPAAPPTVAGPDRREGGRARRGGGPPSDRQRGGGPRWRWAAPDRPAPIGRERSRRITYKRAVARKDSTPRSVIGGAAATNRPHGAAALMRVQPYAHVAGAAKPKRALNKPAQTAGRAPPTKTLPKS